MKVYFSDWLCK